MELDSDFKVFLSSVPSKVKKEGEFVEFKKNAPGSGDEEMGFVELNAGVKSVDEKCGNENIRGHVNIHEEHCDDQAMDKDPVSRKRKRECHLDILNWIRKVAQDPCNPAIGSLPERHKWKYYGSELQWKQILLAREAMLLKKNVDARSQQSVWQKKQKMHPSIYDDDQSGSERLRCSQRLIFAKDSSRRTRQGVGSESSSSSYQSDENNADNSTADSANFWGNQRRKKRVPTGPNYQADLPEFVGVDYESDSKWLGTKIWPLDSGEQKKYLIERDPMGKGRQESCGCQFPGSIECVRFHIREKRVKVKLELGSAFTIWKFDSMGENVAVSWTTEDENKFRNIVESNRLSSDKYFWDELFKYFPRKGREALVSYYFNVFLIRRRGHQNRSNESNIDSDDEESEYGPIANRFGQVATGSIFCSPKKPHSNTR